MKTGLISVTATRATIINSKREISLVFSLLVNALIMGDSPIG